MSLVTLSPPMGIVEEYQRLPRSKMATSVVPAPMSISPTPSSRSSGVRTEALVAIWLRTISSVATPGPLDAALEVLEGGDGRGDDVDVDLELDAAHAQRVLDPVLLVDDELLGDDVDDRAVRRDGQRLRLVDDPLDVLPGDLPVLAGDGHDAPRVEALDVGAGDADVGRTDLDAGHELGLLLGLLDGGRRLLEVDDDPLPQAARFGRADADDLDLVLLGDLADEDHDLLGPDVDADDVAAFRHYAASFCGPAGTSGPCGPRSVM